MRVIAGTHKRRRIKTVDKASTRSTKDRVKETLFNMLGPLHGKTHVLDLFAGAGALGIEALSRGVDKATFVESDKDAFKVLHENLDALSLLSRATLYQTNAETFLIDTSDTYDLIVLDPPYDTDLLMKTLKHIETSGCLKPDGVCVTLSSKKTVIDMPQSFQIKKERTVGITNVCFYEWSE